MMMRVVTAVLLTAAIAGSASAQTKKPSGPKSVMNAVTIKADTVYTGTMEVAVDKGKVTGNLHLTAPTEITGKVAGTAKGGVLNLEFPFHMVERNCDGTVTMIITMPATPGPSAGTMEAMGCGRDPGSKLPGTVELVPIVPKKK